VVLQKLLLPRHGGSFSVDLGRSAAADAYKILDASVTVDRVCAPYSALSTHLYVPHSPSLPPWQGEKSPEMIFLARAEANRHQRAAHREEDTPRDCNKHVYETEKA
jgi:hypothetical protein